MFRNCKWWLALLAALSVCSNAAAGNEAVFAQGGFVPYVELTPTTEPATRGLERRVVFFVNFSCPYCRGIHRTLGEWSKGLPPAIRYEVVPAVGLAAHAPMAVAYYAVLSAAPAKLEAYSEQLYSMLQDEHRPVDDVETYVAAAKAVGLSRETFLKATQEDEVRKFALRAQALTAAYGLTEVPTVVVGNRYLTNPRRVQNQQEAFVMVMNGLVSMLYRGGSGSAMQ